jgi:hypothetical protein
VEKKFHKILDAFILILQPQNHIANVPLHLNKKYNSICVRNTHYTNRRGHYQYTILSELNNHLMCISRVIHTTRKSTSIDQFLFFDYIQLICLYCEVVAYNSKSVREEKYLDHVIEDEVSQNKHCILSDFSVFVTEASIHVLGPRLQHVRKSKCQVAQGNDTV